MRGLAVVLTVLSLAACSGAQVGARTATPSPPTRSAATPSTTPLPAAVPSPSALGGVPVPDELKYVWATSLSTVWAATSKRIVRSIDAGRTWRDVTPGLSGVPIMFALDDQAAWAAVSDDQSHSYSVYRTVDGGQGWQRWDGRFDGSLVSQLSFVDRTHGWMVIGHGAAAGSSSLVILRSTDGGASWNKAAGTDDPVSGQSTGGISFGCEKGSLGFGSETVGILPTSCAGGSPLVYRSTDGGSNWNQVAVTSEVAGRSAEYFLGSPIWLTPRDVLMTGTYYVTAASGPSLFASHDAGATWRGMPLPGVGAIDFESPLSGWLLHNPVEATADGGNTWHPIGRAPPFSVQDFQLQFLGRGVAIAFDYQGAYRTDDGAMNWHLITPPQLGV
jgi:photosystem II stability/assembly factor-like uncharacterized protein